MYPVSYDDALTYPQREWFCLSLYGHLLPIALYSCEYIYQFTEIHLHCKWINFVDTPLTFNILYFSRPVTYIMYLYIVLRISDDIITILCYCPDILFIVITEIRGVGIEFKFNNISFVMIPLYGRFCRFGHPMCLYLIPMHYRKQCRYANCSSGLP